LPLRAYLPEIVESGALGGARYVQSPLPSSRCKPVGTTPILVFHALLPEGEEWSELDITL
jgi:hypothetical protein